MKLTTRIGACLTLLAGLLIATTWYQLRQVDEIHALNRELGAVSMEAARVSIRLLQDIDGLREFAAKSLSVPGGDPDYIEQWVAWEQAVWADLQALDRLRLEGAEETHFARIRDAWQRYETVFVPLRTGIARGASQTADSGVDALTFHLGELLEPLRAETEALIAANDIAVALRTQESAEAVDKARSVAWAAGVGSLVLALFLSFVFFLYISGPLRRLNRGTREIARGNFLHRIEVRGRDELAQLARDFNDMAGRLGEVEEMKKEFISHVSHELKAPLAAIHETVEILLERIPGPITPKQERLLRLSHDNTARLSVMISNLLETSRLDAGVMRYRFEEHDVMELTCDVLVELSPLARDKSIKVRLEGQGPLFLVCDGDRVREVVANLLGNAVKFSPPSSPVRVSWRSVTAPPATAPRGWRPPDGSAPPYLLLSVEDLGPGVPDEHKEGIFEKFYQVSRNGGRLHGQGVGLGLAICRKIVDAHGGAIWVENGDGGRGSRFQALFPALLRGSTEERGESSFAVNGKPGAHPPAPSTANEPATRGVGAAR